MGFYSEVYFHIGHPSTLPCAMNNEYITNELIERRMKGMRMKFEEKG
jgi:hypothetical protein